MSPTATVSAAPQNGKARDPWQIEMLPVDAIAACPFQPRLLFDPAEMAELVESVRANGVQQPILVRPRKLDPNETKGARDGARYELVAGERRLRASREAGRKKIPALVRAEMTDAMAAQIAIAENVQRSNLSPIEEARGYKQLMLRFRMTEERISKKMGVSVAKIRETMKLLALPEEVQALLIQRRLTLSHGQALLPLAAHRRVCVLVAQRVVAQGVTAASLAQAPLPNAAELKRQGLLEEMDYKTKFDWRSVCEACPHKALVKSGYGSYCLRPEEWQRKQQAAIAQQKDEAARALEQVRAQVREQVEAQEQAGRIDVSVLPPGSYRNLSFGQVPPGCDGRCPCRREARHPSDPDTPVLICVDPARLRSLQEAQRQAHEEARRRHFTRLWEQANQVLEAEKTEPRKAAALLATTVLADELHRYGYASSAGTDAEPGALARGVARAIGLVLPWDELLAAEDEAAMLHLLAGGPPTEAGHDSQADGGAGASLEAADAAKGPDPDRLLLFAASLLLVQEVRSAVRFGGETPRLGFVLGPYHEAQLELPATLLADGGTDDSDADEEDLPPHDPGEKDPGALLDEPLDE